MFNEANASFHPHSFGISVLTVKIEDFIIRVEARKVGTFATSIRPLGGRSGEVASPTSSVAASKVHIRDQNKERVKVLARHFVQ